MELWDKNLDGALNETEVEMMIMRVTGGVANVTGCPTAAELLSEAGVASGGGATVAQLPVMLEHLYPCTTFVDSGAGVKLEAGGKEYECHEEGDEDEGDHDHRRLAGDDHE